MSPTIKCISVQGSHLDPKLIADCARRLGAGEVIALPTETVYGLGARADSETALERLRELKQRPESMPLTWHIAPQDVDSCLASFGASPPLAGLSNRLTDCYWPGPLTLVLSGSPAGLDAVAEHGAVGVRCPAHAFTAAVLAACDFPVVMTSANLHGAAPALDAAMVAEAFAGAPGLEFVFDGGPSQTGDASSVLKLGPGEFKLLREGLLSATDLRGAAGLRIGFTCTGNTCRSPMAEVLGRKLLGSALAGGPRLFPEPGTKAAPRRSNTTTCDPADFGFSLRSMGVAAQPGSGASNGSLETVKQYGCDLSSHSAQRASIEAIEDLDVIYALTRSHAHALIGSLPPEFEERVQLIDPEGYDISDPIGGPMEVYEATARQIANCIEARIADWID